jgi:Disulfide bond formation protein DsbB
MSMNTSCRLAEVITPRRVALLVAVVAIATIGSALFMQYVLGILPCDLCLKERVPYYVAIPVALLTACLPNRSTTVRIGLFFLALIFLASAGLAAYHAGVEWKFWAGPTGCSGEIATTSSAMDLLSQIETTTVISCSEASWRFLGLSLAGWNGLISLGLAVLSLISVIGFCGRKR